MRQNLDALIDHEVFMFIPTINKNGTVPLTIRNVETSGLWVENPVGGVGVRRSPDEPYQPVEGLPPLIFFLPWGQVGYILAASVPEIQKRQVQQFD
jgi:hypothetical protein